MIRRRATRMPNVAKYAILAMLLADGLGIYLVHTKINRPALSSSPAMAEASFVATEPAPDEAGGGLAMASRTSAVAIGLAPLPRPRAALPALLDLKPIELEAVDDILSAARIAQRVEREAVAPPVRMAALRPIRRQSRVFSTAFTRDIAVSEPAASFAPDISLAKLPAESDGGEPGALSHDTVRSERDQAPPERVDAPVQETPAVPAGEADGAAAAMPAARDQAAADELPPS